jgi:hypothetical protein
VYLQPSGVITVSTLSFKGLLLALLGLTVLFSASQYVAPDSHITAASAQLSETTAQNMINSRVVHDCDHYGGSWLWDCYSAQAPLISLVGKNWKWGGINFKQCRLACTIFNKVRACEHNGTLGPTLVFRVSIRCGKLQ